MKCYLIYQFGKPDKVISCYQHKNEALLHLALHPNHFYEEVDKDLLVGRCLESYESTDPFEHPYPQYSTDE